jgi:hypothetical protein
MVMRAPTLCHADDEVAMDAGCRRLFGVSP